MDKNAILIKLSQSDRVSFGRLDFKNQSREQQVFSAVWQVESEVNNGGFQQYFLNYGADSAVGLVSAMLTIGAPRTAELCAGVIRIGFPQGLPQTNDEISDMAACFNETQLAELDGLDRRFLAYEENLSELLFDFVSAHPDVFGKLQQT